MSAPEQATPVKRPRRTRERVIRSDGVEVVQTKPPRADILHYPTSGWTTVLVRRTHNLELARRLAEERWALLPDMPPLDPEVHRVGWWQTYGTTRAPVKGQALDQAGRLVRPCEDSDHGAGPGIEFRP